MKTIMKHIIRLFEDLFLVLRYRSLLLSPIYLLIYYITPVFFQFVHNNWRAVKISWTHKEAVG